MAANMQMPKNDDHKDDMTNFVPFNYQNIDFNITKSDIKETKKIYTIQCDGLMHQEEQRDLFSTLAIERKNNIPLLPYLVDSFTRDRIMHYKENRNKKGYRPLSLQEWANDYSVIKKLAKNKKHQNILESAITTFFHRYCGMIRLPVMEKIDDSMEQFIEYIIEGSRFIQTLLTGEQIIPPFQIDLVIIPKKVVTEESDDKNNDEDDEENVFDDDSDESSDESSSDDDDDDDYAPNKNVDEKDDGMKAIGNVEEKLKASQVIYDHERVDPKQMRRRFHKMFQNLKKKLDTKKKGDDNIKNKAVKELDRFAMPYRRRLCIVADRRNDSNNDDLFMYSPPQENKMPNPHVPEWFFQSSFKCLIPSPVASEIVTAKTAADGYVFCLSFQVEQKNDIKCYLYTKSQMARFMPDDVITVLPELFKENPQNKVFLEKELKNKEKQQNIKLIDPRFESFRSQTMGNKAKQNGKESYVVQLK